MYDRPLCRKSRDRSASLVMLSHLYAVSGATVLGTSVAALVLAFCGAYASRSVSSRKRKADDESEAVTEAGSKSKRNKVRRLRIGPVALK
jgi:hypothetical protein